MSVLLFIISFMLLVYLNESECLFHLQTCLVGAGPGGKHTALEAVTIVLDLPPPQPGTLSGLTSIDRVSASDPKAALALQKLVQAAVSIYFFLCKTFMNVCIFSNLKIQLFQFICQFCSCHVTPFRFFFIAYDVA